MGSGFGRNNKKSLAPQPENEPGTLSRRSWESAEFAEVRYSRFDSRLGRLRFFPFLPKLLSIYPTPTKHDQSQFCVRFNNYSSTPVFMQSLAWHNIFGMEVLLLLLTSTGALTTCLLPEISTKTLEVRHLEIWSSDPRFFFQFLWLAPNHTNNWLGYVQHGAWRVHCFQRRFPDFERKKALKTWR